MSDILLRVGVKLVCKRNISNTQYYIIGKCYLVMKLFLQENTFMLVFMMVK
jgi:hypothetical protein